MLYTEKYFHLKLRAAMIIFGYLQVCGANKTAEAELQLQHIRDSCCTLSNCHWL